MKKTLILLLLSPLLFFADLSYAQGSDVTVKLKYGNQLHGELLFVDQTSVVISTNEDVTKNVFELGGAGIINISSDSITSITVSGQSKILQHMAMGILIGIGTGALIGLASGDDKPGFMSFSAGEKAAILGIFLGAVGLVVGLISGVFSSTYDKDFQPLDKNGFSFLREYARYKARPAFLF